MSGPEKTIESFLISEVEKAGGMCIKFKGRKDVPDRVVIVNGLTVFVELKAPGEKPRASQLRMFTKMQTAGAMVFVLDTKKVVAHFVRFITQEVDKPEPVIMRLNP